MCGLAGLLLNHPGAVGAQLVTLMEAQAHRGADSTGFAIYGPPRDRGYIVRVIGFDQSQIDTDIDQFRRILQEHGADFLEDPSIKAGASRHYSARLIISDPKDFPRWLTAADEIRASLEIQSVGRSLEIIKDEGNASVVADKHEIRSMRGTHGLGHARLATESAVLPNASHPFWARPFPDIAIVHNGQITDYAHWRRRLEIRGYHFLTQNDSELIAVWLSDKINAGMPLTEALKASIGQLDGVFTYLLASPINVGFAKDRFAIKPLVTIQEQGALGIATEEQALRRLFPKSTCVAHYDGPALSRSWSAGQGDVAA